MMSVNFRFRGWQPSPDNVSGGQQAVLVAPSFAKSNVGLLLDRLHRTDANMVQKLHEDVVHLRLSRQQRRGIRPVATETTPVILEQPSKGPDQLKALLAPKTPPPGSRNERSTSGKRPEVTCSMTVPVRTDREVVERLKAQLQSGLDSRRSERRSVTPASKVLIAIQEEARE